MTYWVGTSWKMNKTLAEGLAFAEALAAFVPELDDRDPALRHPVLHRRSRGEAGARRDARQGRRAEHALGRRRRLDRRSLAAELRDCGLDLDRARPQRAARVFRRDRRDRRPQDRGRRPPRLRAADLRRRNPRRARGGPRRRGADRADRGRARKLSTPSSAARRSSSPTSRSGRSATRASRPPPTMPTRARR